MELTKKILAVILAIVVIYIVLMVVVAILDSTMHPKTSNSNASSLVKIIAAPIVQTIPSQPTNTESTSCNNDLFGCPNGVTVSRTGPDCQFVCPNVNR
jgi:hypothetical protein